MPPINQTEHIEAKEYLYASLMPCLAERGYYVFSPSLSLELLQQESAADAELFEQGSLKPFRKVFDADAVCFTYIKKWNKSVLSNNISVEIEYIIKATDTSEVLFRRDIDLTIDLSTNQSNTDFFNYVIGMIVTASTDRIVAARKANRWVFKDLPAGKYNTAEFLKDQHISAEKPSVRGYTIQ